MLSKQDIKQQLCSDIRTANYPLEHFLEWMEQQCAPQILAYLDEIQEELHIDERAWYEAAAYGNVANEKERISRWCSHCAQVRTYYQAVLQGVQDKDYRLNNRSGKGSWWRI